MDVALEKVNEDARGAIFSVKIPPDQELMVFFCKAGHFRGGHSHDVREAVLLLSGRFRYHKSAPNWESGVRRIEWVEEMYPGMMSMNEAGVDHMGEFLEDSWLVEWKLNTHNGAWTTTDYEPMREKVRASL
ncbi:MAG: hypothetical protein Q8R28_15435 [Dehalococcoidia bacterium]|nr:hypothetical protein [Dehalococcoidia bacterium]